MEIKWYGTATIGIEDKGNEILFDPFLRKNIFLKDTTDLDGFTGRKAIFITHGHFDHLWDIPALLQKDKDVTVYCTQVSCDTLMKKGVDRSRIHVIAPGDTIQTGSLKVTAYKAKHVVFDAKYIATVVARCVFLCPLLFKQVAQSIQMPLKDEICIYKIDNGEKSVMISGSFGWYEDVDYPVDTDLFVLAHGGSSRIPQLVAPFLEKTMPKKVMFDHWDDAFPPLTRTVNVKKSKQILGEKFKGMEFIVPEVGKKYSV